MRALNGLRRRAIVVVVLLIAASGSGWVVSSQASASGTARRTTASTAPAPIVPPHLPGHYATANASPMSTATNVHCGQTITASVILNGDLHCPGLTQAALTINGGTAAVTVNLNGHTIDSDQSGTCIVVVSPSAIVENGFVMHCNMGVLLEGSKETATKLTLAGNVYGLVDVGTLSKVTANSAIYNNPDGIFAGGIGGTYSGNHLSSNWDGLVVGFGAQTVSGNFSDSNNVSGIDITDPGATYSNNSTNYNGQDGINSNGWAIVDGGGNTAHGNDYSTTTPVPPEQCYGVACS